MSKVVICEPTLKEVNWEKLVLVVITSPPFEAVSNCPEFAKETRTHLVCTAACDTRRKKTWRISLRTAPGFRPVRSGRPRGRANRQVSTSSRSYHT